MKNLNMDKLVADMQVVFLRLFKFPVQIEQHDKYLVVDGYLEICQREMLARDLETSNYAAKLPEWELIGITVIPATRQEPEDREWEPIGSYRSNDELILEIVSIISSRVALGILEGIGLAAEYAEDARLEKEWREEMRT